MTLISKPSAASDWQTSETAMFDGGGHNVIPPVAVRAGRALEGMVVGLRPPAREENLSGAAVQEPRRLRAGRFDDPAGLDTVRVRARRVAEDLAHAEKHDIGDLRVDGRRGIVVEVDGLHGAQAPGARHGRSFACRLIDRGLYRQ